MTKNELKKRLKKVKATNLPNKGATNNFLRRDFNYVAPDAENDDTKFDNFFDFEEELVGLESARDQMKKISENFYSPQIDDTFINPAESTSYFELDVSTPIESSIESFIQLEEIEDSINDSIAEINAEKDFLPIIEKEVESVESLGGFKQCEYVKPNEERCKRQAPKTKIYCAAHRKMIEKTEK